MKIGNLYMTRGVNDKIAVDGKFAKFVFDSLKKYNMHDWGDLEGEDKERNNEALKVGERIVAKYIGCGDKIYIITEYDRSKTTILFCHEY